MNIIISPAKKMNVDDSFLWTNHPPFLEETQLILNTLQTMSQESLQALWKCSDTLAAQNIERLQTMHLTDHLTPAIFSYEGIQYQHMAPHVLEQPQLDFLQTHLKILSGFYGILRPFDGVTPYRLEMQSKLPLEGHKHLYSFWGKKLAETLETQSNFILNLSSKEYSKAVLPHLSQNTTCITCHFAELKGEKWAEKGTQCKMARGQMVQWLAETQITEPEAIQQFTGLDFSYAAAHSSPSQYVFLKNTKCKEEMF